MAISQITARNYESPCPLHYITDNGFCLRRRWLRDACAPARMATGARLVASRRHFTNLELAERFRLLAEHAGPDQKWYLRVADMYEREESLASTARLAITESEALLIEVDKLLS